MKKFRFPESPLHLCYFAVLVVFSPTVLVAQSTFTNLTLHRLDAYIESALEEGDIPGAAVAVVADGNIIYQKGYGVSGPQKAPVTPETPMILGSVSKSFTALAIMQLVEDGWINLDDKITTYFPDTHANNEMTIRNLLTHTSRLSLSEGRELFGLKSTSPLTLASRAQLLIKNTQARSDVGIKFEYSNSNFQLLGAIIEKVSGISYEKYIQQKIFTPLTMNRSFTALQEAKKHGLATGYRYVFGIPVANTNLNYSKVITPSAYLVSTANDMSHYIKALLNRGSFGSTEIVGKQSIEDMFTAYKDNISYGFGWNIGERDNIKVVYHDGATEDFSAYVWLVPSENWGAVILVNAMSYTSGPNIGAFTRGVGGILLGGKGREIGNAPYNYVLNILLALFGLQLLGAIHGGWLIRRWKNNNHLIPDYTVGRRLWHIWLPLLISVLIVAFYLYVLPNQFKMTLRGMVAFTPDAAYLILAGAGFAVLWSALRTYKYRKLLLIKKGSSLINKG